VRDQSQQQARDYVGKVSEATAVMLQRVDAMEAELSALVESLRTGANRLNADLQLLEGNLTELTEAAQPRPRFEPEPGAIAADSYELDDVEVAGEPISAADTRMSDVPAGEDDSEGARLVALNMALNGTPRDETDRYLAENFQLADRAGLLDEVYASVEG